MTRDPMEAIAGNAGAPASATSPDRSVPAPMHRVAAPGFWASQPPRWDMDLDETLWCTQVRQETHDVKTFVFRASRDCVFAYEPGQFVTIELEIDGQALNRCYTISSSPTRPHSLSITVKRVPGGAVSNWLHDHLAVGGSVRVLGPAGEFTSARHPAPKYLFLSAGSGITPLMSMSRAYHDLAEDRDIVFVHSARTPDDIVFESELALLANAQSGFRTAFVCERRGNRPSWPGVTGYLSLPLLAAIAPDFLDREVFVCGPAPYMKAVRDMLTAAGFDAHRYHEESFTFDTVTDMAAQLATAHVGDALAAAAAVETSGSDADAGAAAGMTQATFGRLERGTADGVDVVSDDGLLQEVVAAPAGQPDAPTTPNAPDAPTRYTVRFEKSRRDIECADDQMVLEAAKKAGVRMPSSCRQGMCGTCKVKLVSGEVEMKHAGGIRQREIDQGMVLLCCSKPKSDLVLDK